MKTVSNGLDEDSSQHFGWRWRQFPKIWMKTVPNGLDEDEKDIPTGLQWCTERNMQQVSSCITTISWFLTYKWVVLSNHRGQERLCHCEWVICDIRHWNYFTISQSVILEINIMMIWEKVALLGRVRDREYLQKREGNTNFRLRKVNMMLLIKN